MNDEQLLGIPYHEAAMRICIDGHENGTLHGRVYGMRLAEPIVFGDLAALLTKLDPVLDQQGLPQSYQKKRKFKSVAQRAAAAPSPDETARMSAQEVQAQRGAMATATLRITSRQYATWQGQLIWEGQEDGIRFRSDLELLRLMCDYLDGRTE